MCPASPAPSVSALAKNIIEMAGDIQADLGIPLDAMIADIQSILMVLSLQHHPDKNGDTKVSVPAR